MTWAGLRHPSTVAFAAMLGTALMALYMVGSLKQEIAAERSRPVAAARVVFVPVPAATVPVPTPSPSLLPSPRRVGLVPARITRPATPAPTRSPSRGSEPSPSPAPSPVPSPTPSGPSPLLQVDVELRGVLWPWLKT